MKTKEEALSALLIAISEMTLEYLDVSDFNLPRNTPEKIVNKVEQKLDQQNEINRVRTIRLLKAYRILRECNLKPQNSGELEKTD